MPDQAPTDTTIPAPKSASQSGSVEVDSNFEIFSNRPLPSHDHGNNKAFQATGRMKNHENLFALICDPNIPVNSAKIDKYNRVINDNILALVRHGKIFWPPENREVYALIYHNNIERKIADKEQSMALDWTYDKIFASVITPLIPTLRDMHQRDFFHSHIYVENLYTVEKKDTVLLGDCLSFTDSYEQPFIYNTITRSMADPIARGHGALSDDIYAFGVTLGVLYRASDPLAGMTNEQILNYKIEHGSYAAILGNIRVKNDFLELLRGTLSDDPQERWTVEDLIQWYDGRRLSPKQTKREKKAQRPLAFGESKYLYRPILAQKMAQNPRETRVSVENDILQQWLKRALDDPDAQEQVDIASIKANKDKKQNYEHRLASYISLILDPTAPLRYKNRNLTGDGFGTALAYAVTTNADTSVFTELIQSNLMNEWISRQDAALIDQSALRNRFENCRRYLPEPKIGYGLERCIYTLCPNTQCLSLNLERYYIQTPDDMLLAFEELCESGKAPQSFLDRHCTAFLSVRDGKLVDPFLFDLNARQAHKNVIGELSTLARIQKFYNVPNVPHVAKALASRLDPVYERFHDKQTQEKLKDSIEKHAKSGSLIKMINVLDNRELRKRDLGQFYVAIRNYKNLAYELQTLEKQLTEKATFRQGLSHKIATGFSLLVAVLIILMVLSTSAPATIGF